MSIGPRILCASLLGLVLVGLVFVGRWKEAPSGDSPAKADRGECRGCHASVWDEWQTSSHAHAWSGPEVQAAFQHFGFDRKCQTCHAPEPVLSTGIGEEVLLRETNPESGVNCQSCHQRADGVSIAAVRTLRDATCRPVETPQISLSRLCGTCHDAIFNDWLSSRYDKQGHDCRYCHMPRATDREGRSHHFLGGHDPITVRRGVKIACRPERDTLIVEVTNHATGHNFPGERHNRILLIQVIQRGVDGTIHLSQQDQIKGITPFRGESSAEQIRIDGTYESRFPIADPPVRAEVRLLYKQFPWQTDRDATIVCSEEILLESPK